MLIPFSECHYFNGFRNENGYGIIGIRGRLTRAHRIAYEAEFGPLPEGKGHHGTVVMHICDEPSCVNLQHLRLGTQAENSADKCRKGRHYYGARHHARDFPLDHPKGHARLPKSKISAEDLALIRQMIGQGEKLSAISEVVSIGPAMISRIKNGHNHASI